MTTLELAKSRIEKMDRFNDPKVNEALEPVVKKQMVNGKLTYILQNAETKKWVAITDEQVEELDSMMNRKRYGNSVDMFIFKA